jgi:hypothetical protein
MKNTLNKVFKKSNIELVLVAMGVLLIVEYLIFPGLTAANTLANIASSLGAIILGLFVYYYVTPDKPNQEIEPGETELDYIPQEEVVKKKRTKKSEFPMPPHNPTKKVNPKQSSKNDDKNEPFVKTRKKTKTK